MNKVKAFIVGLYSRFIRYLASTELTRAYADMWGRVAAEKKLADDLTNKVFGLERIKEALLEENKKLAEGFNRLKAENERLSKLQGQADAHSLAATNAMNGATRANEKLQATKQELLNKLAIAEERLRDEVDGQRVINDTNRALEARLKVIMDEMFPGGHGMYIHYYDAKTKTSKPFKIPLKLQKQITRLLSPGQKEKVKKAKAADGNVR